MPVAAPAGSTAGGIAKADQGTAWIQLGCGVGYKVLEREDSAALLRRDIRPIDGQSHTRQSLYGLP
jgi:hypothetical protein